MTVAATALVAVNNSVQDNSIPIPLPPSSMPVAENARPPAENVYQRIVFNFWNQKATWDMTFDAISKNETVPYGQSNKSIEYNKSKINETIRNMLTRLSAYPEATTMDLNLLSSSNLDQKVINMLKADWGNIVGRPVSYIVDRYTRVLNLPSYAKPSITTAYKAAQLPPAVLQKRLVFYRALRDQRLAPNFNPRELDEIIAGYESALKRALEQ